jgi:hypothetical protein
MMTAHQVVDDGRLEYLFVFLHAEAGVARQQACMGITADFGVARDGVLYGFPRGLSKGLFWRLV